MDWINENSTLCLPDLKAKTVVDTLAAPIVKSGVREVLQIRQAFSKTSTAKYEAFDIRSRSDGFVRDLVMYHGASTGRFTGTGVQLQNLPRGTVKDSIEEVDLVKSGDLGSIRLVHKSPMDLFSSCIRNVIQAREGTQFYCGDFSSIEVRVLFWCADNLEGLKAYEENRDLYREIATAIYKVPLDRVTKEQREVGKRAILGCLAKNTPVLTNYGYKPIQEIQKRDWVWNGDQWVRHQGVAERGPKTVIPIGFLGIELTPDHWVQHLGAWRSAGELALNPHILPPISERYSGLRLLYPENIKSGTNVVSLCAAYAELNRRLGSITYGVEKAELVSLASSLFPDKKAAIQTETAISCWTLALGLASKPSGGILKSVVNLRKIKRGRRMEVAGFHTPSRPLEIFWNTLLRLSGLTNGDSNSTASILMDTMNLEIYVSSLPKLIGRIEETYDLREVSNGSRFQAGRALVHNCGYGMGKVKFRDTCIQFGQPVTEKLAQIAVDTYRGTHSTIPSLWNNLETAAIRAVRNPDKRFKINHTVWFVANNFLWCELPSGRKLPYYHPTVKFAETSWGSKKETLFHYGVNPKTKKWEEQKTWGGILTENVVQAIARDLMVYAMLRLEKAGYKTAIHVHDELLTEHPDGDIEIFKKLMALTPSWAEGLPVKVDAWVDVRYHK